MQEKYEKFVNYYKNKTILITGASGYLGSSVIKKLCSVPCKIIALDVAGGILGQDSGCLADIHFELADIQNKDIWLKFLEGTDIIFHFAAQTSSRFANENPVGDLEANLLPVVRLIEACHNSRFRPGIVFSGTVTEVGVTNTWPVNEAFKDQPVTVYDINKLAAEKYLQYYSSQMGGKSAILRLANLYGPGPTNSSSDRGILNLMVKKALKGESLTIYGEGAFMRDYIYIDDVVKAFLMAGANIDVLNGNYYVIGSGIGHTIKEMVNSIGEEVRSRRGNMVSVIHVPEPDNLSSIEFRNFVADSSAFKSKTGWQAEISLREGIGRTIEYFLREVVA